MIKKYSVQQLQGGWAVVTASNGFHCQMNGPALQSQTDQ
jgi:hypothetical protein